MEVKHKDYENSLSETNELLKKTEVTIFEAAIRYKNFFARVDIFQKVSKTINIMEVKSKSVDPKTFADEIWKIVPLKTGVHEMKGNWKSYIYDVAFHFLSA